MVINLNRGISPKNFLERDFNISIGDIVTIDDNSQYIEAYVVKQIDNDIITICGVEITSSKDDVYVKDIIIPRKKILYLGDSFVNINGYLWNIKQEVMIKNKDEQ